MKTESIIAIVLCMATCNLSNAFITQTSINSNHLPKIRITHQVANLRIPFLGRNAEVVAVEEPPTTIEHKSETMMVEHNPNTVPSVDNSLQTVTESIEPEKEMSETEKLLKQVKEAGVAGVISYAAWELGFWAVSVPVVLFGYYEVTGHWPDLSDKSDIAKLSAEAFAFVNFARFAVPLRIGLALSTTPWIQTNVVDRFMKKDESATNE